jgi:methylmalonyl-CoA mutase cobalamin-binding subunit
MAEEVKRDEKKKKKVKVRVTVGTLGLDGKAHERGTIIELDPKLAEMLIREGDVEKVG